MSVWISEDDILREMAGELLAKAEQIESEGGGE